MYGCELWDGSGVERFLTEHEFRRLGRTPDALKTEG